MNEEFNMFVITRTKNNLEMEVDKKLKELLTAREEVTKAYMKYTNWGNISRESEWDIERDGRAIEELKSKDSLTWAIFWFGPLALTWIIFTKSMVIIGIIGIPFFMQLIKALKNSSAISKHEESTRQTRIAIKNSEKEMEKALLIHKDLTAAQNSLEEDYAKKLRSFFLDTFDKNENQVVDELETPDVFLLLLEKHQEKMIAFEKSEGKNYVQLFIQVHERLSLKRQALNRTLIEILKSKDLMDEEVNHKSFAGLLRNEIHAYNVLLASSISMISALISDNRILFYKIYQTFDKLNVFNSNFENESLQELRSINQNLHKVLNRIDELNYSITSELQVLTEATERSTESIQTHLEQVNSTLSFNTLLAGINTYQLYKLNRKKIV